tara:strand:- start:1518 stop:2399 length:882 start_codon:yes stop_codon:yes gene_type:complete
MNDILIVGGFGSIGTKIIKNLKNDFSIHVIDKKLNKNYDFCNYEICDLSDGKLNDKKFPNQLTVIYLTGNLTNSLTSNDALNSINDNISSLTNFLILFSKKIKHMIFVSSVSVYGLPKYNPIDEEHPINPYSFYGSQKACAEIISKTLCNNLDIPLTIIRSSQLFGLNSAELTLPHLLMNNLKNGKSISLTGDPYSERDYLHVSDFCIFINNVIKTPKEGIFNIGSGEGLKLIELFKMSFEVFGMSFKKSHIISKKNNSSFSQILDIKLAQQTYDFKPEYTMKSWFLDSLNKK